MGTGEIACKASLTRLGLILLERNWNSTCLILKTDARCWFDARLEDSDNLNLFLHHFFHLLGESLPLFLVGAVLGAALEIWLPRIWIERWLSGGASSVLLATTAGALLPGCAMSTMPLARSLRQKGTALGTVAAFIMIAPVLSPQTIIFTATLVSLPMAIARVALSFLVAIILGVCLNLLQKHFTAPIPDQSAPSQGSGCCASEGEKTCCAPTPTAPHPLRAWWSRFLQNLRELLPFLVGGLAVAAALISWFPIENYQPYLQGGWISYLVTLLIGIPTYVCDGGEIPLTRALLELGVGPGPAFCFMMASVGTCLPTIAMAHRIIGWRATSVYLFAWLLLAVGGGLLVGALLTPQI